MNNHGIKHSLIIVAEAVKQEDGKNSTVKFADGEERLGGIGTYIAHQIMQKSSAECRVTTLGHVQRGAPPTPRDRILASAFGVYAVDLLANKKFDRMVAWRDRKVVDVPISEGISTYKVVDRTDPLIETALALGVYVGDINQVFEPIDKILNLSEFKKDIFKGKIFVFKKSKIILDLVQEIKKNI